MVARASTTYDPDSHLGHHAPRPRVCVPIVFKPGGTHLDRQPSFVRGRSGHSQRRIRACSGAGAFIRMVGPFDGLVRVVALGIHLLERNGRWLRVGRNPRHCWSVEWNRGQTLQGPGGGGPRANVTCTQGGRGCRGKQSGAADWKPQPSTYEHAGSPSQLQTSVDSRSLTGLLFSRAPTPSLLVEYGRHSSGSKNIAWFVMISFVYMIPDRRSAIETMFLCVLLVDALTWAILSFILAILV